MNVKQKLSVSSDSKLPLEDLKHSTQDRVNPSENVLRPKSLAEYVGQKSVTDKLSVYLEASQLRSQPLDHVLLSGPPGLGKTTLAHIVAREMGGRLHVTSGPLLAKPVDLVALLSNLAHGDVLFIDEIHRLSPHVEETLYPALEDFEVQVVIGEGPAAQAVTIPLQKFTLIGATTQSGKISAPLRDRFGIQFVLEFYQNPEMVRILNRSSEIMGVELTDRATEALAARSRGTPRIGNRLLARVRDYVEVIQHRHRKEKAAGNTQNRSPADVEVVTQALEFLDVDHRGLQPLDRQYLNVLMKFYQGGPAGVEAIAASMAEERSTLEETVEPYLLKEGFIVRTPRGRQVTMQSYQHLGVQPVGAVPGVGEAQLDLEVQTLTYKQ